LVLAACVWCRLLGPRLQWSAPGPRLRRSASDPGWPV